MQGSLDPPKRYDRQRPLPGSFGEEPEDREEQPKTKKLKKFRKSDIITVGGMDIPFFALVIALVTIGLIMLFSATYPYALQYKNGDSYYFFKHQFVFAVLGIAVMLGVSKLDYNLLKRLVKPLFVITVGLLVLVLFYHTDKEDFKRWIPIPFTSMTIQPSEIAKFTIILVLADYISKNRKRMSKVYDGTIKPLLIIALFCGLIYLEHHNSGVVLVFLIGAVLMFCGGTNWKLFAAGAVLAAIAVVFIIMNPHLMMEYAGDRIKAWLDKDYDPLGARWQTNNSLYAIGSGGLFGAGLGNSKQKFLYVSEPQNDFIFSIVCEELGFVGAGFIILLYALLFVRGLKIAMRSRDPFASLMVIGIVTQVAIQTIFNILVVTDTIPNTGISLPFFSYGGTSILMLLFEMGIVLSISRSANQRNV